MIAVGGALWSGLTLLTAFTHTYNELLLRHTLVGIGEAVFSTIAPTFVVDLFPKNNADVSWGFSILRFLWAVRLVICWRPSCPGSRLEIPVLRCGRSGLLVGRRHMVYS